MILQCPACEARYNIPDNALGPGGRNVRCKQCHHEWHAGGPQMPAIAALEALIQSQEQTATPALKPIPITPRAQKPIQKPSHVMTGMVAAATILAIVTTLFTHKPGWFGFKPTTDVILTDLSFEKQEAERGMEYAVSGKIMNTNPKPMKPPTVRITLVDKDGNPMQYWEPMMPDSLDANAPMPFTFAPLKTKFIHADRLVVEIGNKLELAMRRKP